VGNSHDKTPVAAPTPVDNHDTPPVGAECGPDTNQ
jgi:hypothetical protein